MRTPRVWAVGLAIWLASAAPLLAIAGGGDPQYVNMKIYEMRVSASADCSNAIVVFQNSNPSYVNMLSNPPLGAGQIPNGSYGCVMIKVSDQIHFAPTQDLGTHNVCLQGHDEVIDIANTSSPAGHDDLDGTNHANTAGDDTPWVYFFTGSTGTGQNPFSKSGGLPLTSPLVISGIGSKTFVMDFHQQVDELFDFGLSAWYCNVEAPTMSFR